MSEFSQRRRELRIPVTVQVDLDTSSGLWNVISTVDERAREHLGDIGVYEFDGMSDFTDTVMRGVLQTFAALGEFTPQVFYSVDVKIMDGGNEIGTASRNFFAPYGDDGHESAGDPAH